MKSKSLSVPSNILLDQSLNLNQKLILSLVSTEPKMFALNIAKGLGTRRSTIQDDLKELVDQSRLVITNGGNRVAYSKSNNFDLRLRSSVQPEKAVLTSERSKKERDKEKRKELKRKENTKRKEKKEKKKESLYLKLFYNLEDKANIAFDYWVERGGRKHKEGTGVKKNSFDLLSQIFSGTAFTYIPDSVIPNPLLNKTKIFDLEDWKTSIDNYMLSLTSHAHYPISKATALSFRKNLNLNTYIYNPHAKEGNTRSFFLKFLNPPNLIHVEVARYPKLQRQLTKAFDRITLHFPPTPAQIISVSNKYGEIISKYQMTDSVADLANLITEFVKGYWDERRFNPNWMVSEWWDDKLIRWLDKKGLICY